MEAKDRNLTHERRRLLATVNEMMAAHKNAVVIANIREILENLLKSYLGKMTGELSKGYLARATPLHNKNVLTPFFY